MTTMITLLDQVAPDFELLATNGTAIRLSDFRSRHVVLYFYPRDCTTGCTREGQDFRDAYQQFCVNNTTILGVSRDSLKSHIKFKTEQQFPFELLSDTAEAVCQLYGVIKTKSMYGKSVRGIERSTFLLDKNGIVRREWRKVNVAGHVTEVLQALEVLITHSR